MLKTIYIFDYKHDKSIQFLKELFDYDAELAAGNIYDRTNSVSQIHSAIRNADVVYMLGHGNPSGLLSRPNYTKDFDRFLISSRSVDFLRKKICIGIWCNANQFAQKYKLTGLFSGMIISEIEESMFTIGYRPTVDEMKLCNMSFVVDLKESLDDNPLNKVPDVMMRTCDNPIDDFNYNNLHYYINGEYEK